LVIQLIDEHRERFGVEPMCRVLSEHGLHVAPSTFYAAKSRPPSKRAVTDAELLEKIQAILADRRRGRGVYGARKGVAAAATTG
jgi:putative transposase